MQATSDNAELVLPFFSQFLVSVVPTTADAGSITLCTTASKDARDEDDWNEDK
jgi:hypothetical protein